MNHIAVCQVQFVRKRRVPGLAEIVAEIQRVCHVCDLAVIRGACGGRELHAVGCPKNLQIVIVGFATHLHVKFEIDERTCIHLESLVCTNVGGCLDVIACRRSVMLCYEKRVIKRAHTGCTHHPLIYTAAIVQNPSPIGSVGEICEIREVHRCHSCGEITRDVLHPGVAYNGHFHVV